MQLAENPASAYPQAQLTFPSSGSCLLGETHEYRSQRVAELHCRQFAMEKDEALDLAMPQADPTTAADNEDAQILLNSR